MQFYAFHVNFVLLWINYYLTGKTYLHDIQSMLQPSPQSQLSHNKTFKINTQSNRTQWIYN